MENYILKPHTRKEISEAEKIIEKISNNSFIDKAPKRIEIEGITMDSKYSYIYDDGIYAEENNNGYSIFISISDVSEYISVNSVLDKSIEKKITSIHGFSMLPKILCNEILSLKYGEKKLAQTSRIDLNNDFETINTEIFESYFKSIGKVEYEHFEEEYNDSNSKHYKQLQLLYKIALGLNHNRLSKGGIKSFREKITLNLENNLSKIIENKGQFIISEFAIIKNIEDAKLAYKEKIFLIYKGNNPGYKNTFMGNNIDIGKGFYNFKPTYHAGLGTNFFTQTTSPIRRRVDICNQRQEKAWIRKDKPVYFLDKIRKISYNTNTGIEKILELEKNHKNDITKKRVERLIKKLESDDYENIGSLAENIFYQMIKYFINFEPAFLKDPRIGGEIIYRIQNKYLNKSTILMIKSAPYSVKEINIFKEIIKINEETNKVY